jgi:hypothetical protein
VPQALVEWLHALAATAPATLFRNSTIAYATLNAFHIFSIGLVVGSIATLDLRVLGLFRRFPLSTLADPLSRVAATGVYCAALSGFILFSVRPLTYVENPAFLIKITLVGLGVLNALVLRTTQSWQFALEEEGEPIPDSVRAAALRSLLIWAGAVLAGRWIGFLQ